MGEIGWKEKGVDLSSGLLRTLPAEAAHDFGLHFLRNGYQRYLPAHEYNPKVDMRSTVSGIGSFDHPIGLAAGFDKNAVALPALFDLGFAFVEAGTVTPRPQAGNPKPRLFRVKDQHSIINRMGFNNHGLDVVCKRFKSFKNTHPGKCLGINLGKNKDTPNDLATEDYLKGFGKFIEIADYFVINISSPNTPGLRELASADFIYKLSEGLSRIIQNESAKKSYKGPKDFSSIFIKIDPDLPKKEFQTLIETVAKENFGGIILTNTHRVETPEAGGLSGSPIASMSTARLEWAYEVHQGALEMVAVGGIFSGTDVIERVIRGAGLVQIYSSFIYRGPRVVLKIMEEIEAEVRLRGAEKLSDLQYQYYI